VESKVPPLRATRYGRDDGKSSTVGLQPDPPQAERCSKHARHYICA
jgi:hypothetical protein